MATIIYPDGRTEEVQPRNGSDFQLDELNTIVEGHLEIVPTRDGRIMVCNEESKLLELPRNDKATELAGLPTPEERRMATTEYKRMGIHVINTLTPNEVDYIAGTVLVCLNHEVQ